MSFDVTILSQAKRDVKHLSKKYRSLKDDLSYATKLVRTEDQIDYQS
jgi:mRNA-degrading endonuclease RelE of RelBE toxin-antitoxin system